MLRSPLVLLCILLCKHAEGFLASHLSGRSVRLGLRSGNGGPVFSSRRDRQLAALGRETSFRGSRQRPVWPAMAATKQASKYSQAASEASWEEFDKEGECTIENAMYCNLMDAADIACTISTYMEECNSQGKKLPQPASDVLRSLLSHQVGAQGFWTTFLTDPELVASTQAPFDPSLLNAMARFPELNMGVLSSCLAMSATEETVYDQDEDEMMRENAAMSRLRILRLIATVTRQPDVEGGEHGYSWLLDLMDYEVLQQCMDTAEERGVDVTGGVLQPALGIFPELKSRERSGSKDAVSAAVSAVQKTISSQLGGKETDADQTGRTVTVERGGEAGVNGAADGGPSIQGALEGFGKAVSGFGGFKPFGKPKSDE